MPQWVGDLAPSGWFGMLKGRTLGAFLGASLKQPEALIAVRYERDSSDWKRALLGKHVLVVDAHAVRALLRVPKHRVKPNPSNSHVVALARAQAPASAR